MMSWTRGLIVAVGSVVVTMATAPSSVANPYGDPYLPPSCEGHQDTMTHNCRIYLDDPFGVWKDAVEDEFFGAY
ncbi:Uncharacterised protein [Mycobacteroides abscessus subsp. massiliense]|nr:Uncharacterised protein [Mycobacteroides abscessus subsp. massiliense]SKJ90216.1 Uncharacterised protein [Mycobacteroides abscessus subsp. massiliense]SKK21339.1 Uncharacterised protein [Mycobacteroides abscessus subsp. massiliense]SKR13488.1 Uncharacterised protein [Mycobacteroides abscessus subsp. massiliense]SKS39295.1 Uncharacterised protein [Mycobacteroides abscessus subsp. massiliense]